ncbi:hypothetical protein LY78DRAFT_220443 [Colletotrichum sublineola]|nr:hypothetical protein LY78DRAFT_220443 [Colletotrichum sublineola]
MILLTCGGWMLYAVRGVMALSGSVSTRDSLSLWFMYVHTNQGGLGRFELVGSVARRANRSFPDVFSLRVGALSTRSSGEEAGCEASYCQWNHPAMVVSLQR